MRAWLAALVFVLGAGELRADPVPAALRGNSISVNWVETRTNKGIAGVNSGREVDYSFDATLKLYVSVYGRVFYTFKRGNAKSTYVDVSQISGSKKTLLLWRFQDGALVADEVFVRGARRVVISFSDQFNTCSVSMIYGKEGGTKPIIFQGTSPGDDSQYESIEIHIASTSCSIQRSNIFAHP